MLHNLLKNKKIVLASASPRRANILNQIGLKFIQIPADICEELFESQHISPKKYVNVLALEKCRYIKNQLTDDCLIIAADTTVYLDRKIIGKPLDIDEAVFFLKLLSNRTHLVYTGLAISYGNKLLSGYEKSCVKFKNLSEQEIYDYIETKEPLDKAGAYGIQGFGAQFIEKLNGCYFNVMGLPVNLLYELVCKISTVD